jgi:peptidoglycan/xylan/chitin deacetylase (PgdA/CDA1 family)
MLPVIISIDTEYSAGLFARGTVPDCAGNFARSIACETPEGDVGIFYQMDVFDRNGLKGVFFVDPMPALVWGNDAIKRVVQPIIERGHHVQLHLHTEWLEFAEKNPLRSRTGSNMVNFTQADQEVLLSYAMEQIELAGAPRPVAFRAGNYGANDDTLRALAKLGIRYETSFSPGLATSACRIGLEPDVLLPVLHKGVVELPIAAIDGPGGTRRHGQITALSLRELKAAVRHAREENWPLLMLVSHSFELMNRIKCIPNKIVQRRFENFCEWLGSRKRVRVTDFRDPDLLAEIRRGEEDPTAELLPHNPLNTVLRMGEQAVANTLYG